MFQLHSQIMDKEACLCLLFLSYLLISCSGALVGFSYGERGRDTHAAGTISSLEQSKVSSSQIRAFTDHRVLSTVTNSNLSVDLYLNKFQTETFFNSKPVISAKAELKAHLVNFLLPHLDVKSIIVSCGNDCLAPKANSLLLALESVHVILSDLNLGTELKVSLAFPLQLLHKLKTSPLDYEHNNMLGILEFIKETKSFVMIQDSIDGELSIGDHFFESIIKRATLAASVLPWKDVPVVLTIKSQVMLSSMELAQFSKRVSTYLESRGKQIAALYVELHTREDFEWKEVKRREIQRKFQKRRRTLDGTITNTVYPTPIITPSDTPTIITVPSSTNPVTIFPTNPATTSPTNPAAVPVNVPPTTPTPVPTNPATTNPATTVPVTNPVTSYPPPSGNVPVPVTNPQAQPPPSTTVPVTNPVTSYPPPSGNVFVPVTNPQAQPPPSNTNAPSTQGGQSWCVAKPGAPQASLQSALDYACGMSADCSQIQQGGSCYSPITLQNHASFAFNSYYQKNPAPTSCDFGGAATLVNTNPSSGSCIFPSSSSASSSTTAPIISSPTPPTPTQSTSPPPPSLTTPSPSIPTTYPPSIPIAPPTTSPGSGSGGSFGYGSPPSVLNSSNPGSSGGIMPAGFGSDSPPVVNTTSAAHSLPLKPFTGCIVLIISFVTATLSLRP